MSLTDTRSKGHLLDACEKKMQINKSFQIKLFYISYSTRQAHLRKHAGPSRKAFLTIDG